MSSDFNELLMTLSLAIVIHVKNIFFYLSLWAKVRVRVRLEFWQNAHVCAMCVRPKIECANVRACEAKIRCNSQFAAGVSGYYSRVINGFLLSLLPVVN
jgi:hypothetical protein